MDNKVHEVPVLFYVLAVFSILYFIYNLRRLFYFSMGKDEQSNFSFLDQAINLISIGIGQKRVYSKRFAYASVTHFLLGWGFIILFFATTVDFFASRGWFVQWLPEFDTPWFAFLNDTGGLILTIGCVMAIARRHLSDLGPVPQNAFGGRGSLFGDTGILIFIIFLNVGGFITEASRLAIESPETAHYSYIGYLMSKAFTLAQWESFRPLVWWGHAITSLIFISLIPLTKMFHFIPIMLNIALTRTKDHGRIRSLDISKMMEDEDADPDSIRFGANKASDFSWKQLLEASSCTECARCTSVCPASSTDKPLSPMKIVTDIRAQLYSSGSGSEQEGLLGSAISHEEIWSCTTCGACMEECPVLIGHVPMITDFRRHMVLDQGMPYAQSSEHLEHMQSNGNPWGMPKADRTKWIEESDFDIPFLSDKKEVDVLYWVGCAGSYDPRNQGVARDLVRIMTKAGIDFAVLGKEETCTGDSARRLGDEYLFETLAKENIESLDRYKFNRVVTACPHCFHTIANEYKDFGGEHDVVHHSEFINDLIENNQISLNSQDFDKKVTYHDPCYLGRHNDIYDEPRSVIQALDSSDAGIVEMDKSKENSFCCGAGGGNMWYEIDAGERINTERFNQAKETGAQTVATSCSFCMIMLDDAMKVTGNEGTMEVKDIAELVAESI